MRAVNRLIALAGLAIAVWLLDGCMSANQDGTPQGRNVLLIVADDLNCSIGSFGDSSAVTPHLDNLGEQGVRFSGAHCQYPLCGPSRTSFLTGLYPSQSGVRENRILLREALPDVVTLPQLFRMHGYDVVRVGKLFHYDNPGEIGTSGQDDNPSWDETYNPSGRDKREEHLINSLVEGKFGGTLSWYRSLGEDMEYTDGMVAQIAEDKLDEFAKSGASFFLAVGFFRPHTPFLAPAKYFDLHPAEGIVVPNPEEGALKKLPVPAQKSLRAKASQLNVPLDTAKQVIQAYRASVSFVDAQVGRVLDALQKNGLDKNTLVVFLSDHGYHLGEHGHWQKQTLFEQATKVPLIVRRPTDPEAGMRVQRPVELLDVYPTLATWAGIPYDASLPGVDLFADAGTTMASKTGAYTEWRNGASLRTGQHRITRWGDGGSLGWELYDHSIDPEELNNVAADEAYMETFDSLRCLLMQADSACHLVPLAAGKRINDVKPIPRTPPLLKPPYPHTP